MKAHVDPDSPLDAGEIILTGEVICPGIGVGQASVLAADLVVVKRTIPGREVSAEQQRYSHAVQLAQHSIRSHVQAVAQDTPQHGNLIFEAQKAILHDDVFHKAVHQRIAGSLQNAEWALEQEGEALMAQFEAMRDPVFQARAEDIRDMVMGVLAILINGQPLATQSPRKGKNTVLVTTHLHPSTAIMAQRVHAAGFATHSRVVASHAAILLKGFSIPSVGSVEGLMESVRENDPIIIDAVKGWIIVRPAPSTIREYRRLHASMRHGDRRMKMQDVQTADGQRVRLLANVGSPEDIKFVFQYGLEGVGLFRTEFLLMEHGRLPSEEEQLAIYQAGIKQLEDRHLVIRTFDIGADKQVPGLTVCTGQNPALGVRGIRRHLATHSGEFRSQLRAILRASAGPNVGIMIPMVTTVEDVRAARKHLRSVREELLKDGFAVPEKIRFGAMIEVPAAAIAVKDILKEADFVSLGTNDLLQYFTAADRDNEDVVGYNDPESHSFLWLMEYIIKAATEMGRQEDVTICGEIASRPNLIPRLLRLGYRSFSIVPVMADAVRTAICETNLKKG